MSIPIQDKSFLAWLALLRVGLFLVVAAIAGMVAYPAFRYNAVSNSVPRRNTLFEWLPQGWNFFTRSGRESIHMLYRHSGPGGWERMTRPAMTDWLGFGRRPRATNVELGRLLVRMPESAFQRCAADVGSCLDSRAIYTELKAPLHPNVVCGDVAIIRQAPIPWAWSHSRKEPMPMDALRLRVICGD